MRLILKIAVVSLLAPAFMWAAPPQCKQDSLTNYIALGAGGCELGGVVYANFQYLGGSTGGAPVITAGDITVTPSFIAPSTGNLTFTAPWKVGGAGVIADQSQTSNIMYSATITNGETSSDALSLALGTVGIAGTGSATVTEVTDLAPPNYLLDVYETCNPELCKTQPTASLQFSNFPTLQVVDVVNVVSTGNVTSLASFEASLNTCFPCP